MILSGLVKALNRSTPEQDQLADLLQDFYSVIGQLLARVNVHNDAESCQQAIDCLHRMGLTWRNLQKQAEQEPREAGIGHSVSVEVSA